MPTEISALSLHDALPIFEIRRMEMARDECKHLQRAQQRIEQREGRFIVMILHHLASPDGIRLRSSAHPIDRKSTRLNSSHLGISYAVFCLKKKNTTNNH